jgi:hypothetical protein
LFAPLKFGRFPGGYCFNCFACVWYRAYNVFVQNAHTARRDRASRQFFEPRHAEFAHNKNIERRAQALRYLISNRHAAARQT